MVKGIHTTHSSSHPATELSPSSHRSSPYGTAREPSTWRLTLPVRITHPVVRAPTAVAVPLTSAWSSIVGILCYKTMGLAELCCLMARRCAASALSLVLVSASTSLVRADQSACPPDGRDGLCWPGNRNSCTSDVKILGIVSSDSFQSSQKLHRRVLYGRVF